MGGPPPTHCFSLLNTFDVVVYFVIPIIYINNIYNIKALTMSTLRLNKKVVHKTTPIDKHLKNITLKCRFCSGKIKGNYVVSAEDYTTIDTKCQECGVTKSRYYVKNGFPTLN